MDQLTPPFNDRRRSTFLKSRPVTSYMEQKSTMLIHPTPVQDALKWRSFRQEQERESGFIEDNFLDNPFLDSNTTSTLTSHPQHVRRHSNIAQSVKSGFSALGRRMSMSIRGGRGRVIQESLEVPGKSTGVQTRSHLFDNTETASSRPKTRGLFNSLAGRRRPSMPILNSGPPAPEPPLLNQYDIFDPSEIQTDDGRLAPALSTFALGGAGARASAAAQNEAMMAMRETPLPTYHAAVSDSTEMRDSESGIGISLDDERAESSPTHVARCDPKDWLATELLEQIFSYLDAKSLLDAGMVSKRWAELTRSQPVWREVFYREYGVTVPSRISLRPSIPGMGKNVPGQDFQKLYSVRKLIDKRWASGEAAAIYLNGHKDSVYCVQFDENKIITGSRDNTIRIWDARTYQCIHKIGPPNNPRELLQNRRPDVEPTGIVPFFKSEASSPDPKTLPLALWHRASVLCLQYDDEILVTGSSDFTCIVWSIKDGYKPLFQLVGHTAGVLDVCIDSTRIITCSKDTTIRIWDRFTGQRLNLLTGHRGPVNAVQVRGNLLASASGDGMSKLWRLEDGMCIKEFRSKERGLACVEFSEDGRTIFAGGNDQVIYEYNTVTGNIERELQGHSDLVRSLHLDTGNGRIVSGSYDNSIKVWDSKQGLGLADGGLKINLEGWTSSWILAAKSNYRKIACASQDGRVVIVDFGYGIDGVHLVEA